MSVFNGRSCQIDSLARNKKTGFTLIEVLICTFLIAIITSTFVELFGYQIAEQQLNEVTHAFIQDAQLARQLSRQLNKKVTLQPLNQKDPHNWSHGWAITRSTGTLKESVQIKTYSLMQHHLNAQVQVAHHLLKDSQQFTDMSAPTKHGTSAFKMGNQPY